MSFACFFELCASRGIIVIIDGITTGAAFADVFIKQVATIESTAPDLYLPLRVRLLSEVSALGYLLATQQQQLVVMVHALVFLALLPTDGLHPFIVLLQSELVGQFVKGWPRDTHHRHHLAILGHGKRLGHPFLLLNCERVWMSSRRHLLHFSWEWSHSFI